MSLINALRSARLLRAAAAMTESAQVNANNAAQYLQAIAAPQHRVMAETLAAGQIVFAVACGAAVTALNDAASFMAAGLETFSVEEDENEDD